MTTERDLAEGLRNAASHAPEWDDSLLPDSDHQPPAPHRTRRIAAIAVACLGVLLAVLLASSWLSGRSDRLAVPLSTPTGSATQTEPSGSATPPASPSSTPAENPPSKVAEIPPAPATWPLVGTTWVVNKATKPVADRPLASRNWLRLNADGTLAGHDWCTTIAGRYAVSGDRVTFTRLARVGAKRCAANVPADDLMTALRASSRFYLDEKLGVLGLSNGDGLTGLDMWPVQVVEVAPPKTPLLRVTNRTGHAIARLVVNRVSYGALQPGQTSDFRPPTQPLYSYAQVEVEFDDGRVATLTPSDYVGEVPLASGYYTLTIHDQAPKSSNPRLMTALVEAGLPAPGA